MSGRWEGRGDDDPLPIREALDRVIGSLRPGAERAAVGGVFGRWDEAVGPALAAHIRPVRLERGTLLVEASDPGWATQVRFLTDDLRTRLAEVAGVSVERVEVRVASTRSRP
ncbi:MAG: DUF721 domain-containing protein [Actinomycetota bacterium]|nr:DUF721 domain-containing protein [Acidimicrobiia bacterium]MDQ3470485.1 DUF721 domain-containing protein [Actinomycetota bacterium]